MKTKINWNLLPWKELKAYLEDDSTREANLETARRITLNYEAVVNYYLSEMSQDIVAQIDKLLGRNTLSEYYEFLSKPIIERIPQWRAVSLYNAKNSCTLKGYTSKITIRHFQKIATKEKVQQQKSTGWLEYKDYESLLLCDQENSCSDDIRTVWVKKAYQQLSERDQLIILYTVIEKLPAIEVYEELESMIHPKPKDGMTSDEIKANWSIKRKQDAISLLKGYALNRLYSIYNKIKEQ